MKTTNVLLIIFTLILGNIAFGQQEIPSDSIQSTPVHELDKRGGFQDIKLNTEVTLYEGLELKKEIKSEKFPGTQLYVNKKGSYESIGRVPVKSLDVLVYKGLIYAINVEVEKDDAIYSGLKNAFGESRYNSVDKAYYWSTKDIRLYYRKGAKDTFILEYYSYIIERMRIDEIRKQYTDVADDF